MNKEFINNNIIIIDKHNNHVNLTKKQLIDERYKLYYPETGSKDGSTAYYGWTDFDRLVVIPIRSF